MRRGTSPGAKEAGGRAGDAAGGSAILRAVVRNLSWLTVGEVLLKLALLGLALVVARGLGAEGLGTFTLGYSAALMAVVVLALGQVETLIRETAARPAGARRLLAAALRLQSRTLALSLPAAAVALLFLPDGGLAATLAAFLPYAALRARLVVSAAPFKGIDRMDVEVKARGIEAALAVPLGSAAALAGLPVWSLGVALTLGAGSAVAWLAGRVHQLPGEAAAEATGAGDSAPTSSPPPTPVGRDLLAEGWPFLALALLSQLLFRGDLFLLESLGAERAAVGHYGGAATVVWGAVTLPQLVALALYPTLSRRVGGRATAVAAGAAGVLGGAALAGALTLASPPLVRLAFGADFAPVVPLLRTLAWALPGAAAAMLLGTVLASRRRQHLALALQALAVGALLLADLWIIPVQGAAGAAWVAVAAQAGLALAQLGVLLVLPASKTPPPTRS